MSIPPQHRIQCDRCLTVFVLQAKRSFGWRVRLSSTVYALISRSITRARMKNAQAAGNQAMFLGSRVAARSLCRSRHCRPIVGISPA